MKRRIAKRMDTVRVYARPRLPGDEPVLTYRWLMPHQLRRLTRYYEKLFAKGRDSAAWLEAGSLGRRGALARRRSSAGRRRR